MKTINNLKQENMEILTRLRTLGRIFRDEEKEETLKSIKSYLDFYDDFVLSKHRDNEIKLFRWLRPKRSYIKGKKTIQLVCDFEGVHELFSKLRNKVNDFVNYEDEREWEELVLLLQNYLRKHVNYILCEEAELQELENRYGIEYDEFILSSGSFAP